MAHGSLQEILDVLADVPKEETELLDAMVNQSHHDQVWVPNPGPQTEAYFCKADELFYGGQAGGGKTDLGLGLALTAHTRSLILRRTTKEVNELVDRMEEILGSRDGWGGVQAGVWRRPGGVLIGLGGCNEDGRSSRLRHPSVQAIAAALCRAVPVVGETGNRRL